MNLNGVARGFRDEVDRLWPGESVYARALALSEETGEVSRAILKREHACKQGTFKGMTPKEWTENLRVEVFQAIGVLLDIAAREQFDVEQGVTEALEILEARV